MGKRIILILAVVISTRFVRAEKAPWASDSVPAAIKARGRMLEEYDVAPWHAADAVQAFEAGERQRSTLLCKKEPQRLDGCIRAPQSGERQISDSLMKQPEGLTPEEFKVREFDPPVDDTDFYLIAARVLDKAFGGFKAAQRPYNAYVFPSEAISRMCICCLRKQTMKFTRLAGMSAYSYLFTAYGSSMLEKRTMHKTLLDKTSVASESSKLATTPKR